MVSWYEKRENLQEEKKRRVQVASQFLHYGIIAENLERFIHFFIVLDSLFGERHQVEAKITEGIQQVFPNDKMWEYKISRLFDLRSDQFTVVAAPSPNGKMLTLTEDIQGVTLFMILPLPL